MSNMDTTSSRPIATKADMAAIIRSERALLHCTQDELAERSGLSKSTIVRFEKGSRAPDTDQLAQLGSVFGLSVSEILAAAETAAKRRTDGRTDGRTAPNENRKRQGAEGQLALTARTGEDRSYVRLPEHVERMADEQVAEILDNERVKPRGRSGS